jgi:hypothetical protein
MEINAFGLGINSDDVEPFFGSDFHMPFKWASHPTGISPGPRARPGMRFLLFGDGGILASALFLGCSEREHRWEHRPSDDGRRHDYGRGLVLDLDPNSWDRVDIDGAAAGQSYRYGHLSEAGHFTQVTAS